MARGSASLCSAACLFVQQRVSQWCGLDCPREAAAEHDKTGSSPSPLVLFFYCLLLLSTEGHPRQRAETTTMDPSLASALQAWKLETEFRDGERHHKVLSGVERWVEERHLGNGTFGCVYQERCVSGPSASAVRAVKQILKYQSKLSHRELQALTTFSDARVPEVRFGAFRRQGWLAARTHRHAVPEPLRPLSRLV
jgi:hypothetical protein